MLTSRHALERKKNTTVGGHSWRGGLFTKQLKKWVKTVFLLDCYGCIFHGTGNSAPLCQNFGISGWGVWTPQPPPLGTPLTGGSEVLLLLPHPHPPSLVPIWDMEDIVSVCRSVWWRWAHTETSPLLTHGVFTLSLEDCCLSNSGHRVVPLSHLPGIDHNPTWRCECSSTLIPG